MSVLVIFIFENRFIIDKLVLEAPYITRRKRSVNSNKENIISNSEKCKSTSESISNEALKDKKIEELVGQLEKLRHQVFFI